MLLFEASVEDNGHDCTSCTVKARYYSLYSVLAALRAYSVPLISACIIIINVKTTFIKTVIGDVVAYLKPQKFAVLSDL